MTEPSTLSTRDVAIARAERIRAGIRSLTELQQDIAEAYQARDWQALGYETWDAYVTGEFADALPRLDRDDRRELVVNLRAEGLSTRAIASATGVDHKTVHNDQRAQAGGENSPPAPVVGIDGKRYAVHARKDDSTEMDEQPAKPASPARSKPRPRVDVQETIARVISALAKAEKSAELIQKRHLKGRDEEDLAYWSRELTHRVQTLQRLIDLLNGEES